MGFIYKVTNTVNGKVYIGKTIHSIDWRWNTHLHSAYNERMGDYDVLFHRAIRKYGIDAFDVVEIEKCENAILGEREKYWIEQYDSYSKENGYNCTLGGEGSIKYKDEDILRYWNLGYGSSDISRFLGCSRGTARVRLLSMGKSAEEIRVRGNLAISEANQRRIYQYNKNGIFLKTFYSVTQASKEINCCKTNIASAAKGNIKSAGGYLWSYEKVEKLNPLSRKTGYSIIGKYDLNENLIEIYLSLTAAHKNTGISRKKLSMVAETGESYKGFYWRYINIENGIIHIQ